MRSDGWGDLLNPFTQLAGAASRVVADAWTVAMLGVWNAGLWLLRLVLGLLDDFLTPDLRETGPVASTYRQTAYGSQRKSSEKRVLTPWPAGGCHQC